MEKNIKIAELDGGLEIWKLVISNLKEQDINAQVMDDRRMKILTANIKNRGALESLPYVLKQGDTFTIISGHHRVRAANAAGLKYIYALVETTELTKSQVVSKQIAHNELVGTATFLPEQLKDFQTLVKAIDSKAEMVGVAPLALFDDFSKAMVQFGKTQNIKSIGATIQFLTELALKEVEAWQDRQNTTQSTTTRG